MERITEGQVKKVAELARLELNDNQVILMEYPAQRVQLKLLMYFEQIRTVNLKIEKNC